MREPLSGPLPQPPAGPVSTPPVAPLSPPVRRRNPAPAGGPA